MSNKALAFRQEQKDLLHGKGVHAGCSHVVATKKKATLGDVSTLNLTMLRAGVQAGGKDAINVIPSYAEAGLDIRISPHLDPADMAGQLDLWCEEVTKNTLGLSMTNDNQQNGVHWDFFYEPLKQHATTATDASNPWWQTFCDLMQTDFQATLVPEVFPAATDSRFLRAVGTKAFGFSPMRNTPILLHEHNEYLTKSVFVEGCNVYIKLLRKLAA